MKQLSDKAIAVIGDAFNSQIEGLRLIPVYGPSDRGGVVEWMAKVDLAAQGGVEAPADLSVFVSLAAWSDGDDNEFAATIETAGAIRTSRWVARWESDTLPGEYRQRRRRRSCSDGYPLPAGVFRAG